MGRQEHRLARPLDRTPHNTGIIRKTGERIGVQHEGAVLRVAPQRLQNEVHGGFSHPRPRTHDKCVLAGIAQDRGEVGGAVAGGQHDGGEMGGVDPQRRARARQSHQSRPHPESSPGAEARRARGPGTARATKSVAATRKKVNDDEANGIAQLEREGMQVVKKVNSTSFSDALKGPYANYAKEFGADKLAAIQAVK